ncbi:DNA-binding protein inhibitor ID-2-like [Haliotis asinina]|uniref:DNA-binding protein inhibitor ID-2-like n=1 Tax=Haliotis asinina TaxID=109174 RepID=UPI0035317FA9
MKAVVETCVRADFGVKDIKITKPRIEDSEMSACFHKLKELVPSVPQHKRISKVALLQHVIDYILDLEITLEKHPAMASIPPPLAAVCRSPLTEKSDLNAQIEPACDILMDTASSGLCDLRPPSK